MMSPSDIHFLQHHGLLMEGIDTELLRSRLLELGEPRMPKVQVARKGGSWFALNSGYLRVLRDLERKGHCEKVRAEVVPLAKVPETVQRGMVVHKQKEADSGYGGADHECYRITGQGYCRVPSACLATNSHLAALAAETDDTSSYTSSDYSDYDDDYDDNDASDSEYDDETTCNVCQRGFDCSRSLLLHQRRSRHFGCAVCGSRFPDLQSLELHREGLEHWDEEVEGHTYESDFCCTNDEEEEEEPESDVAKTGDVTSDTEGKPEEVERLL